jgi:hypothetical protein
MTTITPIIENKDLVLLDKKTYVLMLDAFEQAQIFTMLKQADKEIINDQTQGDPIDEVFARIKSKNAKV